MQPFVLVSVAKCELEQQMTQRNWRGVWGADWRNCRGANELELITLPWCYKQIDNKTEAIESVFPLLPKQGNQ